MNKKAHDISDSINSVLWFLMDAFYIMDWKPGAYFLTIPVIVTGMCTLFLTEKRADLFFSTLALNCWILMNVFWMFKDVDAIINIVLWSRIFLGMGLFCLTLSVIISGDWRRTFSSFKRMRMK